MFGSLRIRQSLLTQEDRDAYRAHFCGACHANSGFGKTCSLLTNYDETVLVLLASGLQRDEREPERLPCTAWPLRRVGVQPLAPQLAEFVAAATLAATGAKLRDDVDDGDRRWIAKAGLVLLRGREQRAWRALERAGFDTGEFERMPARQRRAERGAASLDDVAEPSAELVGSLFAFVAELTERPELEAPLRALGRAMGTFVYVDDAIEDFDDDVRRGRFNPLLGGEYTMRSLRTRLATSVDECRRTLAALPLRRPSRRLLEHLVESMHRRVVESSVCSHGRREAGDCDVCSALACLDCGTPGCCECAYCCDCGPNRGQRREERMGGSSR